MNQNELNQLEHRLQRYYEKTNVNNGKAIAWIDKGIEKAKQENHRPWRAWLVSGLTIALLGVIIIPNMEKIVAMVPSIGTIANVGSTETIQESTGQTRMSVERPVIEEDGDVNANDDIDAYVQSLVDQYHLDTVDDRYHYDLISDYSVVSDNHRYLSIRFNTSIVMAGATSTVHTFTIDKASGNVVTLMQALGQDQALLDKISDHIKSQMIQRMEDDPDQMYWLDDEVEAWNFDGLDGNESFYFDEQDQLVIEFDEYEVAPGYMGVVSFTIPLEVTGDLINP